MTEDVEDAASYEQSHVHDVYEKIAGHFSSTRYKPWPVVDQFLKDLPSGAIGLDVGCGNGKYLTVNKEVYIVASDRSTELIKIASSHQPHSAIVADILDLPHPKATFDFAISIAVIHHLSTPERRTAAISAILNCLKPSSGQALFFAWALEQKASRRGWDDGDDQDVLVPWVLKANAQSSRAKATESQDENKISESTNRGNAVITAQNTQDDGQTTTGQSRTYQRYYHLYRQGELEENVLSAGGEVIRAGYDRDNWWVVARRVR